MKIVIDLSDEQSEALKSAFSCLFDLKEGSEEEFIQAKISEYIENVINAGIEKNCIDEAKEQMSIRKVVVSNAVSLEINKNV